MEYLKTYLNRLRERGKAEIAQSVEKTAEEVGSRHIQTFSFLNHEIGLLFGNVQSGKTGHMFGVICKATDLGFAVFVILTTDNVALQQQTLNRALSDLEGFCICGENDGALFTDNRLQKPTIIVLKKNARVLKLWSNILNSTGFMKGNPLFIIDDEADAASLNTKINNDGQSAINRYLETIKNCSLSSIYLQVTGTPQAIFLQTLESGWRPSFTYYFQPGNAYLGGDFFFPSLKKSDCVTFLDSLKNPIRTVVVRHLAVSAQILASGGTVANCLLHPSVRVSVHAKLASDVQKELNRSRANLNEEFKTELKIQYESIEPTKTPKLPFEKVCEQAMKLLERQEIKVLVMNGKTEIESSEYSHGCNFIIGGNTLGRGVTFPGLQTICYTRANKAPQADTMWQHSRMFGYDRDPGMMTVFIEDRLYKLFTDINATNNSMISQIDHGIENVKLYYPKGIKPTRKEVLDSKRLDILTGGTNYYPFDPDNDSIETISKLLQPFSEQEPYYQVSLRTIKEALTHVVPSEDFKLSAILSVIDAILAERATTQGILIVRRNRNVTRGTGALLSSNDWKLGGTFVGKTVLTMYQVTGNGWKQPNLWVPNIKLPDNALYYEVE